MLRWALVTLPVVFCAVPAVAAEKPVGSWTKAEGEAKITFQFKADVVHIAIKVGDNTIAIDADYGISKDGHVFGRISKVVKPGDDGPAEGDLFSFKVKVEKDKLTLSELQSSRGVSDEARRIIEGDYAKEK